MHLDRTPGHIIHDIYFYVHLQLIGQDELLKIDM